jgi:hypothetical protein
MVFMKKQFIGILLILVMGIQLLPVTQISMVLFETLQMSEELPGNDGPATPSFSEEVNKHFAAVNHEAILQLAEIRIKEVIHSADKMFSRFLDDVLTQPPNC